MSEIDFLRFIRVLNSLLHLIPNEERCPKIEKKINFLFSKLLKCQIFYTIFLPEYICTIFFHMRKHNVSIRIKILKFSVCLFFANVLLHNISSNNVLYAIFYRCKLEAYNLCTYGSKRDMTRTCISRYYRTCVYINYIHRCCAFANHRRLDSPDIILMRIGAFFLHADTYFFFFPNLYARATITICFLSREFHSRD